MTLAFGSVSRTPCSKPAWNFWISALFTPPMKPTLWVLLFSAAATPARYEPSCSAKTIASTFLPSGTASTTPKVVSGKSLATFCTDWL